MGGQDVSKPFKAFAWHVKNNFSKANSKFWG